MRYGYYPGCSLEKNARAYHDSAVAVAQALGIEFVEVPDWNCCGATEYMALNALAGYALIARNLALAARQDLEGDVNQVVAPCSACFLNLSKTDHYMAESPRLAEQVNTALQAGGLHYQPGSVRVRHLLDVVIHDVGLDAVRAKVKKPLYGLRLAPYYGCLIVRPGYGGSVDNPEYPTGMDHLLQCLGATVVDYPVKTHCCGGHMTQISEEVALELLRRLLKSAADYEADAIVTLCPMCQLNLDAYQDHVNRYFGTDYHIPVLYFTQMMGIAFGFDPKVLGFGKEFVDARPLLDKIQAEPSKPTERKKKPRKGGLPMPE